MESENGSVTLPVYLDNNATTQIDARVLEEMMPFLTSVFGNAASRTHSFGFAAEGAVGAARPRVGDLIGAAAEEIVW
ncbi:partial Cysteine desulfurase IscS, partial [uncultured bacterium]